ncbi:MAG: LysR family transcriptional regulator [Lautropia sp.]|nr:LysR family transcriptional regulator [Lautropia sp.]
MTGDLRKLTLDQFRTFLLIAEHQSFTTAAQMLHRTQTTLTRQIQGMEDVLGTRLLHRTRGHVEGLTDTGKRLLPLARKIVSTVDDACESFGTQAISGRIRIGVMDDVDIGWLHALISRFRQAHPECDVRAVSDFSIRLEKRLLDGELDLALTKQLARSPSSGPGHVLRRESLVWASGPGFRWEGQQPLPLVLLHEGCVYRRHLIRQLDALGIASKVAYDGQSYASIRDAVFAGLGITALAESQVKAGGLKPLRRLGPHTLPNLGAVDFIVRNARGQASAARKAFLHMLMQHASA